MKRFLKVFYLLALIFFGAWVSLSVADYWCHLTDIAVKAQEAKPSRAVADFPVDPRNNPVPLQAQDIPGDSDSRAIEGDQNPDLNQSNAEKPLESPPEPIVKNNPKPPGEQPKVEKPNSAKPVPATQLQSNSVTSDLPPADIQVEAAPGGANQLRLEQFLNLISTWWLGNPLDLQIWYLFFLAGLTLYLFNLKRLRRPLLFLSVIVLGFYLGSSLDPVGAVFDLFKTGFRFDGVLILLGIIIGFSFFFGRFFCGWICPLGGVQEFINPETKSGWLSQPMDNLLKFLKYIVLLVFFYLAWRTGTNPWNDYEPLKVLVRFSGTTVAVTALTLILLVAVFIERPFCRYLCPLGAILALTSRLAPLKMRSDAGTCMVCGKCTEGACQMNAIDAVNPVTDLPRIESSECIHCLRCQNICHRSALRLSLKRIDRISGA